MKGCQRVFPLRGALILKTRIAGGVNHKIWVFLLWHRIRKVL